MRIRVFLMLVILCVAVPALRDIAALHLPVLPPPLGFRPPSRPGGEPVEN